MEAVLTNTSGRITKRQLHGRDYYVAPATLIVPGVLNGSQGRLYYPPDEVAKDPTPWNGMPLVATHPTDGTLNISGRDPDVLEAKGIGAIYRANSNGKLKAEAWFDIEATRKVDNRILQKLEAGQPVELSTGLYTDNEYAPGNDPKTGRPYDYIARNYRPDHVAVLVDQVGACSIADGCGVLVNAANPFNSKQWKKVQEIPADGVVREIEGVGRAVHYPATRIQMESVIAEKDGDFFRRRKSVKGVWQPSEQVEEGFQRGGLDRNPSGEGSCEQGQTAKQTGCQPASNAIRAGCGVSVNSEGKPQLTEGWLPLVTSAFCPTGEGGGIDPTCSPSGSDGSSSRQGSGERDLVKALDSGKITERDLDRHNTGAQKARDGNYRVGTKVRISKAYGGGSGYVVGFDRDGSFAKVKMKGEVQSFHNTDLKPVTANWKPLVDNDSSFSNACACGGSCDDCSTKVKNEGLPSKEADVDPDKACEIVKHGEVHGKPLTEAQRGMFGAICSKRKTNNAAKWQALVANREQGAEIMAKLTDVERQAVINEITANSPAFKGAEAALAELGDDKLTALRDQAKETAKAVTVANAAVRGFSDGSNDYRLNPETGNWERRPADEREVAANKKPNFARKAMDESDEDDEDDEDLEDEEASYVARKNARRMKGKPAFNEQRRKAPAGNADSWLQSAPPEVQAMTRQANEIVQREKDGIIGQLLANVAPSEQRAQRERFQSYDLDDLRNFLSIMPKPEHDAAPYQPLNNRSGRQQRSERDEDLLIPQAVTFGKDDEAQAANKKEQALQPLANEDNFDEEEYLKNAPAAFRHRWQAANALVEQQRHALIDEIVSNVRDEEAADRLFQRLQNKSLDELKDLAYLRKDNRDEQSPRQVNYFGSAGGPTTLNKGDPNEDVLPIPTMSWEDDKPSAKRRTAGA